MGRLPQRLRLVRVWSLCLGASLQGAWWKPEMGVGGLCVLTQPPGEGDASFSKLDLAVVRGTGSPAIL